MGLMRALTLKRANRSSVTINTKGRPQISLPTELISTTNNLSFTAPSIEDMQHQKAAAAFTASQLDTIVDSETNTVASEHDRAIPATPTSPTDSADTSRRNSHLSNSSEPSLTDASSVSSSLDTPDSHPDEHMGFTLVPQGSYFAVDTLSKPPTYEVQHDDSVDPLTVIVPALPRRAPSHSKREHERLARRRSQRNSVLRPLGTSALVPRALASPAVPEEVEADFEVVDKASPEVSSIVPSSQVAEEPAAIVEIIPEKNETKTETTTQLFSQELEQLLCAVEQLSLPVEVEDEDTRIMRERGLTRFSISGYLDVVEDVWGSPFDHVAFGEVLVGA